MIDRLGRYQVTTQETKHRDGLYHTVVEELNDRGKWEERWTFVAQTKREAHKVHREAINDVLNNVIGKEGQQ